jgi:hypothetical protein
VASSRGQPDCWKPYASCLGKVKLNLDCWIFYQEGCVNIDRNREVRADRMESVGFINIAPVGNHKAMVAPSSAPGLASRTRRLQTKAQLRAEGRVRRQRSQDVGNTLRAGCSRVSMRRVRTAHRAVATRCYLSADRSERRLRRQPLDPPRFALARIAKAIMQAVGTALPEFDSLRFHPITTPVGWTGNFLAGKSLF